jgi:DNA-binding transcriptional MocR family regulator
MGTTWPVAIVQSFPDQAILQRIVTSELLSGHTLPSQRYLAQSMGVGLSVIREAVQRLAASAGCPFFMTSHTGEKLRSGYAPLRQRH